ncbi:uncharacterized protein LOC117788484 [Drosophila innubila]|uniref:uncharacterized protein LOC117788484 n=1 Tax=Drosophila innubila TaxID=198719 RepID=UPI00148BD483|nr:uncharacterized protein LOC117788484 [Drosophila innubila]
MQKQNLNCHQYILCLGNDKSVIVNCPVNAWYDPKSGNCGPDVSSTACLEYQITSTTSTSSPNPDELCLGQELGVSYPLMTDCKKYIVCLGNGEAAIVNCIFNAWYDPLTGDCGPNVSPTACMGTTTTVAPTTMKTTSAISTTTTQSTTSTTDPPISPDVCGGLINGEYVAYPDNCSKYIVCVEPIPIAFYCTPGYYFNEELQVCVDWAQSDCPAVLPPEYTTPGYTAPSICENNNDGTLPYPENCRWFIKCINDVVSMMGVCNNEEYYDPSIGNCSASASPDACLQNYSTSTTSDDGGRSTTTTTLQPTTTSTTIAKSTSTTTTTTTTPAPSPDPCEDVPVGKLVPYPYDCTKFIKCERPTPVVYDCVKGQEFSAKLERCMAPWVANCTITGRIMKPLFFKVFKNI